MSNFRLSANTTRIGLLVALFVAAMFWRTLDLLLHPRLWAEEGYYYYAALQDGSPSGIFLVVNGNFQLLTNLLVLCATLAPAAWAAHVTTGLALAVAALLAALVALFSIQHRWHFLLAALAVTILALLPQGYEIYLSATNVQWVCSATMLLMSVLSLEKPGRPAAAGIYLWSAVCGLTGVPSLMLAPVFLMRKWVTPSPVHWRVGLILTAAAVIQIAVLLHQVHPGRDLPVRGLVLILPLLLQTVLAPLLGVPTVNELCQTLFHGPDFQLTLAGLLLAGALPAGLAIVAAAHQPRQKRVALTLAACWLGITTLNVIGSVGNPGDLFSGWMGGRYFFVGAICFVLLLALATSSGNRAACGAGLLLLACILFAGAAQNSQAGWKRVFITGSSWQSEVERCAGKRPCKVVVWPKSARREFELRRN